MTGQASCDAAVACNAVSRVRHRSNRVASSRLACALAVASGPEERFPDVLDVSAAFDDSTTTWSFAVTISSPYDTPDRYADGWRVLAPDGSVLGEHSLAHDHAVEQSFTCAQRGVSIPPDVAAVTIEGRHLQYGFGGRSVTIELERGSS